MEWAIHGYIVSLLFASPFISLCHCYLPHHIYLIVSLLLTTSHLSHCVIVIDLIPFISFIFNHFITLSHCANVIHFSLYGAVFVIQKFTSGKVRYVKSLMIWPWETVFSLTGWILHSLHEACIAKCKECKIVCNSASVLHLSCPIHDDFVYPILYNNSTMKYKRHTLYICPPCVGKMP
jgi:hypothetical protein